MRTTLLWPYNAHALEIPETIPLGLGYLLANLPERHAGELLDCTLDRLAPDSPALERRLRDAAPDVVGISFWSSNAQAVHATGETVRRVAPGALVVHGGPHATSHGRWEVEQGHADYALAGDGERSFPALLDALEADDRAALARIPGLIWRAPDGVRENPVEYVDELDSLGDVDYSLLRLADYHAIGYGYRGKAVLNDDLPSALIMATRGCPYRCTFCSAPFISGKPLRFHSPEYVARTVRNLYEDFGIRLVSLGDDQFTLNLRYARAVCEALAALELDDLVMATPNGIRMRNNLDEDFLRLMMRAGWQELTVAPESGSKHTLGLMKKDLNLAIVKPFLERCRAVDMKVKANFIIGYPGERPEDVDATARFIEELEPDNISLCFFQPLPGTPIFDRLVESGEIAPDFVPARYSQLTYCPEAIDPHWLVERFNAILNGFRDRKGWKYKNARVGTIRGEDGGAEVDAPSDRPGDAPGDGSLPHTVCTKGSAFEERP